MKKILACTLFMSACGFVDAEKFWLLFEPDDLELKVVDRIYQPPRPDVGYFDAQVPMDAQTPADTGMWSIPSPPMDAGMMSSDVGFPTLPCGRPYSLFMPVEMNVSAAASALTNGFGRIEVREYNGFLVYTGPIQRNQPLGVVLSFPRSALKCVFILFNATTVQRAEVNVIPGQGPGTNCQCEHHFQ